MSIIDLIIVYIVCSISTVDKGLLVYSQKCVLLLCIVIVPKKDISTFYRF